MTRISKISFALFPASILLASCNAAASVDSPAPGDPELSVEEIATYDEPWAAAFVPGTETLIITLQGGAIQGIDTATGRKFSVQAPPDVAYGGQGGLGDIAFLESEAADELGGRTVYLSWAQAGAGRTRGAVVGKGQLNCAADADCKIDGLQVIWEQSPKVTGNGHFGHRIRFSPDEQYLFVSSGDRRSRENVQDISNTIGSIVRLNLDGTAADGNPFATYDCTCDEIWSYGHRNPLGMDWDTEGRLWVIEHGPAGGDELNLIERGANYGWPVRSHGNEYNGTKIADHTEDDGFTKPAIHWTPVLAPGDMIFYRGDLFDAWKGDALIAGLRTNALIRVEIEGETATEAARYALGGRLRSVDEGPDGALWLLEDGEGGRLLKVTAK